MSLQTVRFSFEAVPVPAKVALPSPAEMYLPQRNEKKEAVAESCLFSLVGAEN